MAARLVHWMFFGLCLMQALFFAAAAVLPLRTVGPPALDRPILRIAMWQGSGQPLLFALTVIFALLCLALGPRPRPYRAMAAAALLLFGAHGLLVAETGILVEGDALAMPLDAASRVILATRLATCALAIAATALAARIALRQLLRGA